ncbi:MAG: DnaJ domain-containing protein [Deltaproteobacteria bacterium]|nr:DnaJ domain-containing protein [Deltaproteobacteria bacterium]
MSGPEDDDDPTIPDRQVPFHAPPDIDLSIDDEALLDAPTLIREWAASLEEVDYFVLLQLPRDPLPDEERVREAWRVFALAFHPDRHRDAPEDVRRASTLVFQRGAEAYHVLQDPAAMRSYVEQLGATGALRMTHEQVQQSRREGDRSRAQDLVHSPAARAFAEKADEALAAGKLEAARLQLQLALMREAGNARLEALLRDVDAQIAAHKSSR